jgi:hypothetical protein
MAKNCLSLILMISVSNGLVVEESVIDDRMVEDMAVDGVVSIDEDNFENRQYTRLKLWQYLSIE